MKFWEAMKALEEGKVVRCIGWMGLNSFCSKNLTCGEDATKMLLHHGWLLEWELYEEPEQTLSFAEVVKWLKEGKRFKRKEWHKDMAVCCCTYQKLPGEQVDNEDLVGYTIEGHLEPLAFSIGDFEATDWVEVK